MLRILAVSSALMLGALVVTQAKSMNEGNKENSLARVRNRFDLTVKASYADTTTLFGPSGERAWAGKDWNPQFLYPSPEHDEEGAVFTVQHGSHKSVWVNSIRDIQARHFQYVYFIPDALVTVIDVHFSPVNDSSTRVEVTYTRTALNPEANDHVRALGEKDITSGPEWQESIDHYLKSRNQAAH
jgi:hypothetical protein